MIEIIGRQSSHYTRCVRMLAHELGVPYALRPIHDLLSQDPAEYGGNPALKLPAVRIGADVVWGSLAAARVIARSIDGGEARVYWPEQARETLLMNAHEMVAHAMAMQVEVVFHEVVCKRPPDAGSRKRRLSQVNALAWLDQHWLQLQAVLPDAVPSWLALNLFCLLEHLPFRNPIDTSRWTVLAAFAEEIGRRPSALATPYRFDPPPAG